MAERPERDESIVDLLADLENGKTRVVPTPSSTIPCTSAYTRYSCFDTCKAESRQGFRRRGKGLLVRI